MTGDSETRTDALAPEGRRAQRRAQHEVARRRLIVLAAAVAVIVAVIGAVVLAGGGSDEASAPISARSRATSTSAASTTTTTAVPVPTTAVPRSADPVVALAQQYDGRYVGTFTNTTFGTGGSATLELRIDPAAGTVTVDSEFDGDLYGLGPKVKRRIMGTVTLGDPNAAITTQTKAFGAVTGKLDNSLALILTAPDVPETKVKMFELTGRLRSDNTGFDATFTIGYRDGTTSVGTVTVLCDPSGSRGSEVTTVCALSAGGG